jgi:hypothetical protein
MSSRADVLAGLERELRYARDVGEVAYARQLQAQIAQYSAGSGSNPATETTGRTTARKKTT